MEMKMQGLIMGLLVLSFVVVGEVQGALYNCCFSAAKAGSASSCMGYCVRATFSRTCCKDCGGVPTVGKCPSSYPAAMLYKRDMISDAGTTTTSTDYCILGCSSSMCDPITAGLKFNAGEGSDEVKEAVQHCNNACSLLCNDNKSPSKVELQLPSAA